MTASAGSSRPPAPGPAAARGGSIGAPWIGAAWSCSVLNRCFPPCGASMVGRWRPSSFRYDAAMAKVRRVFVCRECGSAQHRWAGKCPDCGAWDALEEQTLDPALAKDPQKGLVAAWGELTDSGESGVATAVAAPARPIS